MAKTKLNPVSKRLSGDLGRVQILLKEVLQKNGLIQPNTEGPELPK